MTFSEFLRSIRKSVVIPILCFLVGSMGGLSPAEASSTSGITYHGRILKPDGTPLDGSNVQFRLQIRTPDNQNCLLFEEIQTLNMKDSNGVFSLTIKGLNRGNDETSSGERYGLDRIFQNRGKFEGLPNCVMGDGNIRQTPLMEGVLSFLSAMKP